MQKIKITEAGSKLINANEGDIAETEIKKVKSGNLVALKIFISGKQIGAYLSEFSDKKERHWTKV